MSVCCATLLCKCPFIGWIGFCWPGDLGVWFCLWFAVEDKRRLRNQIIYNFATGANSCSSLSAAMQRINGRLAMWAFASIVAGELGSKTPALEQGEGVQKVSNCSHGICYQSVQTHVCNFGQLKLCVGHLYQDGKCVKTFISTTFCSGTNDRCQIRPGQSLAG
eukprot:1160717-Pelagomonas_calceolata.AAC.1